MEELLKEIQALIDRAPYTREEIAAIWKTESEEDWLPENILALAAAYEYMHKIDNRPEAELLRAKYERVLDELKETYGTPTRSYL